MQFLLRPFWLALRALHASCTVASCTLGTYMGKGYMKTRKAFPQGVFTALSLILSSGYLTSIL